MKQLKEFEEWFEKIATKQTENYAEKVQFVRELKKSPFVEYHYSLLKNKDNIDNLFWLNLRDKFDAHKEHGELFLLSKLDNNEDVDFHSEIIFLLGLIRGNYKHKTLEYARKLTKSTDDYTRDRAIIVLGWLGTTQDTEILEEHLLNDKNSKCRAWGASSFMQMWFKSNSEDLKLKSFKSFQKALTTETDYFVLAVIIGAIRETGQKKFDISQKALDNLETEKIDIAKIKVQSFLAKTLNLN